MRILSGIQPTGQMHIGNYLGAGLQYLEYQDKGDFFLMVADLHALTVPQDPKTFSGDTLNKALELLAIGIDPAKCTLFVQSHVKEHTELAWILNTITPLGELERMTQYKDKSKKHKDNINAGLLDYPVLMAADILLYKTDVVPVGQDQTQHLELARTLAKKFNSLYGETFPEPKTMLVKEGAKIMSLLEPKKKMSKSDNPDSFVAITDDPETIKKKIAKAVTDTGKDVRFDPAKKPGISNLLTIYSLFSKQTMAAAEKKFKVKGYALFKKALATLLIEKLEPFRRKYQELKKREVYVKTILNQGSTRAKTIASSNLEDAKRKVGLLLER
ncbi:MAG: tryptophan--tRNA ligase [Candidatus Wildermuthbacteria bacterium RIFCSPLOWO2_01_FULL_47_18]|uniref:Tryptophan--tRNA ligase n=2 Tax=Candidatus Wildermuthiibacteriota TaxID=1817923 RepID=A0A1G2RJ32_9BACT|nr:MAG: tryptophan--tRNA ligase [Candidatus Wildermuthbacteria bacterium RIFCSPLOWO2_01_FULL_47_18]